MVQSNSGACIVDDIVCIKAFGKRIFSSRSFRKNLHLIENIFSSI